MVAVVILKKSPNKNEIHLHSRLNKIFIRECQKIKLSL